MQWSGPIQTLSGFGVLFDPSVVSLRQPADAETLEAMAADGSVLSWPALGEEIIVTVIVDQELPARLAAVASREAGAILRVPSGAAWLADATCLDQAGDNRSDGPMQRVAVAHGEYLATAHLLHWPERDANAHAAPRRRHPSRGASRRAGPRDVLPRRHHAGGAPAPPTRCCRTATLAKDRGPRRLDHTTLLRLPERLTDAADP